MLCDILRRRPQVLLWREPTARVPDTGLDRASGGSPARAKALTGDEINAVLGRGP